MKSMRAFALLVSFVLAVPSLGSARAEDIASGGPLDLRAPRRVRLEPNARVTVRARAATEPELAVSSGTIGEPRRVGEDQWEAEWTLPKERHPDVAFLTAWTDGGHAIDWLCIWRRAATRRGR